MAQQHPSPETVQPKPHAEDEIVHTPTKHRARWIMGILLLILILTTFTVGDEIKGLLTGQGRGSAYLTWNRPGVGKQSITFQDWQACGRSLSKVFSVLEIVLKESDQKERVASFLVLGALAKDAGVAVTDEELGSFILRRFGVTSVYAMALARFSIGTTEFEETLRQELAVERYTTLLTGAWNTPDVSEIEKTWKNQHQEYAFDYLVVPVEQSLEAVKATAISDEELHSYFDGLPQPRKDSFKSKEKLAADLAGLAYEGASPETLLAKFPPPTDEAEIEKQARAYFDGPGARRFAGKPYEEVQARARTEALAYGALQAWLADMRSREERGLAVNLAADASVLGVALQPMPAALTQSEWVANKPAPWMGPQTAGLLFGNANDSVAGKFYPKVIVDESSFTIVHVNTKEEPAIPPFEQLADKLRDELWQKRARESAVARLEALRDQFGTRPVVEPGKPPQAWLPEVEEAKFYEVARAAGYEPQLRDFKERISTSTGEAATPIELFARTQPALFKASVGTVMPAGSDFEGKHAFLLRARGARDPDLARMKANEFANVSSGLQSAGMTEFRQKAFSLNALQSRYELVFNEKPSGE